MGPGARARGRPSTNRYTCCNAGSKSFPRLCVNCRHFKFERSSTIGSCQCFCTRPIGWGSLPGGFREVGFCLLLLRPINISDAAFHSGGSAESLHMRHVFMADIYWLPPFQKSHFQLVNRQAALWQVKPTSYLLTNPQSNLFTIQHNYSRSRVHWHRCPRKYPYREEHRKELDVNSLRIVPPSSQRSQD